MHRMRDLLERWPDALIPLPYFETKASNSETSDKFESGFIDRLTDVCPCVLGDPRTRPCTAQPTLQHL